MRRSLVLICAVSAAVFVALTPLALAQFYQQRSSSATAGYGPIQHFSLGTISQPGTIRGSRPQHVMSLSASVAKVGYGGYHHHHHHHRQFGSSSFLFYSGPIGYPMIWSGGYTPVFSPLIYPYAAPANFGYAPVPLAPVAPPQAPANPPKNDVADPPVRQPPKATNVDQKALAGKFMGFGDVYFGKQKYLSAVERYKTAAQQAPDLAEPYFRQACALVALGQYEGATKAFRRGLHVRSDWADAPFRLDQVYVADKIAKTTHQENLAKAVEANPLDANLLVALGMHLFLDGQRDRADVFFGRAAQLGGNEDKLLDAFLPKPAPAGADKAPANAKIVF